MDGARDEGPGGGHEGGGWAAGTGCWLLLDEWHMPNNRQSYHSMHEDFIFLEPTHVALGFR
jgi:hypothetical protein